MNFESKRLRMVERQLALRDIHDAGVLSAMGRVEREKFVSAEYRQQAYYDSPLPIGYGQTISQPYIVALMTQSLQIDADDNILEIGTGSGYAAAVLAEIARSVVTVEYLQPLAEQAAALLKHLGYHNVLVVTGDGSLGYPQNAPYDGIVVTAGGPDVPQSLLSQLKPDGRLVIPVGSTRSYQQLIRVTRQPDGEFTRESLCDVRFVPLFGKEGWQETVH